MRRSQQGRLPTVAQERGGGGGGRAGGTGRLTACVFNALIKCYRALLLDFVETYFYIHYPSYNYIFIRNLT